MDFVIGGRQGLLGDPLIVLYVLEYITKFSYSGSFSLHKLRLSLAA